MSFRIWETPSGRFRRWGKRGRGYTRAPMFARMTVVLVGGGAAWDTRLARDAATAPPSSFGGIGGCGGSG